MKGIRSFSKEFIFDESNVPFQSCHASSLSILPDGSIFAAWFAGTREGADDVKIWGARRTEGFWDKPHILTQDGDIPHWNPVPFVNRDKDLLLFYKKGAEIASWQTWLMQSDDFGEHWSVPHELVPGDIGGRGPVRNNILRLSDGRLLAPASLESGEWRCFVDRSDDEGKIWKKSNEILADLGSTASALSGTREIPVSEQSYSGRGVIQPTLWESSPGHVSMLMRSSEGWIYRSDSPDSGISWCRAYRTGLPNNNSGIDLTKTVDGRLFLVCNPVGTNWGPRSPLVLESSEDGGNTWEKVLTLEDTSGEYSYPYIICGERGLLISYTYQRKNIAFWDIGLR